MKGKVCFSFTFIVMICLIFCFGISANAAEIAETGKVGDNVTWSLHDDGELVISGTGEMYDYDNETNYSPFHLGNIRKVVIEDGVTSIGSFAFCNCTVLTDFSCLVNITAVYGRHTHNLLYALADIIFNLHFQPLFF